MKKDPLEKRILGIINRAKKPLLTVEIALQTKESRYLVETRLNNLLMENKICGRKLNTSGRGIKTWWRNSMFHNKIKEGEVR